MTNLHKEKEVGITCIKSASELCRSPRSKADSTLATIIKTKIFIVLLSFQISTFFYIPILSNIKRTRLWTGTARIDDEYLDCDSLDTCIFLIVMQTNSNVQTWAVCQLSRCLFQFFWWTIYCRSRIKETLNLITFDFNPKQLPTDYNRSSKSEILKREKSKNLYKSNVIQPTHIFL